MGRAPEPAYAATYLSAWAELLAVSSSEPNMLDHKGWSSIEARMRRVATSLPLLEWNSTPAARRKQTRLSNHRQAIPHACHIGQNDRAKPHVRFASLRSISLESAKTNTSSPVTVLMS